ncbi:MAG: peptidoglycan DD-metalloendopeptidase family protein [Bacteroidetes bacterium]|nr:peptidoglycan DD-metalloendopeptidase family protein [Bacteroidota bacterium]
MNKSVLIGFCLILSLKGYAQSSEKLKKEQDKLELKIKSTKLLLDQTKSNTEASLNELKLIENQVKLREQLVRNFDNQIRTADVTIVSKADQIKYLERKLLSLKAQYKKLLIYAYKKRNKYGKLMYIFSSKSYNQALKRKKYLESIQEIQQKQFLVIQQNQQLIKKEISEINKEKQQKLIVLDEKRKEKDAILIDKSKQETVYNGFKNKEQSLYAQLREDEKRKANLNEQISIAIKKEIAAAEAKRKAEEERKRKEAAARKVVDKKTTPNATTTAPALALTEAREGNLIDKSFEVNRGRLPWPVDKGSITENFGRNPHPTLDNVFTNNNGIDISAPKNAEVRSVFEGEVTSILNIPGAGKVVILKHGNYRTVYSNLQSTYVSIGDKISTKQAIGSLLVKSGQSLSVVHFEIHQVIGSNVQSLNPAVWVDR